MKRLLKVFLCMLFAFTIHFQFFQSTNIQAKNKETFIFGSTTTSDEVSLHSEYAILINLNDDRILYDKNAMERMYPASMTKIMTTLVAIENIEDLDARCTISEEMLSGLKAANASVAGFKLNESVSYRDLLYGILLPSGADASRAIAISIFNDESEFIDKMNEKAVALKMSETHFVNVSGLHDEQHYSSVYDISLLLKAALKNELFKDIYTTKAYQCENGLQLYSTMYAQAINNNMDVDFINGAKTGFTNEASLCLASYSEQDGEQYIMVNAQTNSDSSYPYHVEDAINLYRYIFSHYSRMVVVNKGDEIQQIPIKWSSLSTYKLKAAQDISVLVKDGDVSSLSKKFKGSDVLEAPISVKDIIGEYTIYDGDIAIYASEILIQDAIDKNLFAYYLRNLNAFLYDYKLIIGFILIVLVGCYAYKRHQKKQ